MNRRTFLAGCSTLLAGAPAVADPTKPDIARLIDQLGSKRFGDREAAAKALNRMGQQALAGLRKAAQSHSDAEVRRRAVALIENIEKNVSGEVRCLAGHTEAVKAVAFLAAGQKAVSTGVDGTIRIWGVATGNELRRLRGKSESVQALAVAPDGKRILAGNWDPTISVWDLEKAVESKRLVGHQDFITSVAWLCDGKTAMSASHDGTVRVWDVDTGRQLRSIPIGRIDQAGVRQAVPCIDLSADGTHWLACAEDVVQVRSLTGKLIRIFHKHTLPVTAAVFSPDGRAILSSDVDGALRLWDVGTGRQLQQYHAKLYSHDSLIQATINHYPEALCMAFLPGGARFISGHIDWTVRVWEVKTARELRCSSRHGRWVNSVACSRDGKWALSGSADKTVRLWRLPT